MKATHYLLDLETEMLLKVQGQGQHPTNNVAQIPISNCFVILFTTDARIISSSNILIDTSGPLFMSNLGKEQTFSHLWENGRKKFTADI